jgi:diadenosine tetraphosphatase ApaH/serine/threonine PP2A family protein phosphatase
VRIAVISDIHANLPALEAVLEAIEAGGVDEIWCLGDVVGYGAQPDACVELIGERCAVCLLGNHDIAVLGGLDIASFSEAAAIAVHWTRENIAAATLDFLRELEPAAQRQGIGLYHASPRDPVWEYVLSIDQAQACMEVQEERIGLIGHSHVALFFSGGAGTEPRAGLGAEGSQAHGSQAGDGTSLQLAEGRWLINPGSVGQPRDGDPRAAWLELDSEAATAKFHRVVYPIQKAADSISAAGLPERLANRLYIGL